LWPRQTGATTTRAQTFEPVKLNATVSRQALFTVRDGRRLT
jgi:hypothetical protein